MPRVRALKPDELDTFMDIIAIVHHRGRDFLADWQLDFLKDMIEYQSDLKRILANEPPVDTWMRRHHDRITQYDDREGGKPGCWVWTGASQGGTRPVVRENRKTLPVRALMLKLYKNYLPPESAHISTWCGTTNCIQPDHLIASQFGTPLWPLDVRDDPDLKRQLVQQSNDDVRAEHARKTLPLDRPLALSPLAEAYHTHSPDLDELIQSEWENALPASVPARTDDGGLWESLAAIGFVTESPTPTTTLEEGVQDDYSVENLSNRMCEQTRDLQLQLEHLAARLG